MPDQSEEECQRRKYNNLCEEKTIVEGLCSSPKVVNGSNLKTTSKLLLLESQPLMVVDPNVNFSQVS
jgi:hypothetical protein